MIALGVALGPSLGVAFGWALGWAGAPVVGDSAAAASTTTEPPAEDASAVEAGPGPRGAGRTTAPRGFRIRAVSAALGAEQRISLYTPCDNYFACATSPWLGADIEAGGRFARIRGELYTSPLPHFEGDAGIIPIFVLSLGATFGNEIIRGTVGGQGGVFHLGAHAGLLLTPWRDRFDQGHGIELRVGYMAPTSMTVALMYRWYPRRLNGRGRKRSPAPTNAAG